MRLRNFQKAGFVEGYFCLFREDYKSVICEYTTEKKNDRRERRRTNERERAEEKHAAREEGGKMKMVWS